MLLQIVQRIGIPFVLLFMATLYFFEVRGGKPQDLMLIKPVYCLMAILFFINAATDMRALLRDRDKEEASTVREVDSLKKILQFSGLTILLVAALPFTGFLISAALFIFAVLAIFKVESKTVFYAMPPAVTLSLYLLFEHVFGVELPVGFLGF